MPFLVAADAGVYTKHGLEVHRFITPGAAEDARRSGVVVPEEYVRRDITAGPVAIGGGSPMIYRAVNGGGMHRVIVATHGGVVRSPHHRPRLDTLGRRLDTPAMRQRRAEEFYDASIVEELDRSGYLDAARR
ncbi:MAG: hypothetical protein HYU37_07905 [Acidobacteria bacterium]|nr:hypothetical protein [Acidobacteriota bacterium]